ncbi:MAG: ABC transporter permease [Bacteroidales bacterium]|nr:ABC transporter permease [Bacteroidales bacterium]
MNDFWMQAFRQLKADRFRTLLSLLGVAVGIFSIVAALTLVDCVQTSVREGFAAFGSDLLFVEREPLEPDLNEDGVFRWWAYAARPPVRWKEYRYLAERGSGKAFERIAFAAYGAETVGVDGQWKLLVPQALTEGRGFTQRELENGLPVAMAGAEVEAKLGEALWLEGRRYQVIGRFEKAGINTVSPVDVDHSCLIPFKSQGSSASRSSIVIAGARDAQVRAVLRECRRLGPGQKDNFALNRLSFLLDEMDDIFSMLAKLGWIVGIFSLLVGGFGIANMLYVSVEERKPQIGICRALGAKRKDISREFLGEAGLLSLLGGGAGILMAGGLLTLVKLAGGTTGLPLALTLRSVAAGIAAALGVGIVSGVAPARHAARLNPVDAIKK